MKCFYHKGDLDGKCSGALVKITHPECEMFPIEYGEEFPYEVIQGDEIVYVVDFSIQPFDNMFWLNNNCKLIWIDHHISAMEDYRINKGSFGHIKGYRDTRMAACELTYWYLFPQNMTKYGMSTVVYLLGRYDIWDHSDQRVLPFQMGMRQEDWDPSKSANIEKWEKLLEHDSDILFTTILDNGETILEYQKQFNEQYVKEHSFETEIDGLKVIAANIRMVNSKLFDSVWDPSRHDAMLTFGWKPSTWIVSLYTPKEEIDVSQVAKGRGGGGHAGAAGFPCNELPFELK